ncbi:MAG: Holliday junction branch migration protein RuvA [Bdellovibrionales bacterium]
MIGKLTGIIDNIADNQILLDVNGVGYVATCSARTLRCIGPLKSTVSLLIETQVREDAINLFGFADAGEQDWFRLLTTVQGVGARVALAILGSVPTDELAQIIVAQDKAALTKADGVGPKLALRLVTELKDKVPNVMKPAAGFQAVKSGDHAGAGMPLAGDAVSALVNLGYRRAEAFGAVAAAARQLPPAAKLDELIRASLAELSRGEKVA